MACLCAIVLLVGVSGSNANEMQSERTSVTKAQGSFFIKMDEKTLNKFLCKVELLQAEDSYSRVIGLLGEPTYDIELYQKDAGANRTTRFLRYYTTRMNEGLVNEIHDAYIDVELAEDESVVEVHYRNLEQRCGDQRR